MLLIDFQEQINLAAKISLQIPAPFMRIDFYKTKNDLYFGEFTPSPGGYEQFDDDVDSWLGDLFLEAEGRLIKDLYKGKKFELFNELIQDLKA